MQDQHSFGRGRVGFFRMDYTTQCSQEDQPDEPKNDRTLLVAI
jgi:hypothetical protein